MNEVKLGTRPPSLGYRDAVHVAMIAVKASADLERGQYVRIKGDYAIAADKSEAHGIVDPFLAIRLGSLVWVCLFPDSVTGMQHVWQHPTIAAQSARAPIDEDERLENP